MDKSPYISRATLVIAPQRETLWCLRQRRWIIPPKKILSFYFLWYVWLLRSALIFFGKKRNFNRKRKGGKKKKYKKWGKECLRVRQPDRCPRESLLWQHGTFATMVHPAPVTFNSNHTRGSIDLVALTCKKWVNNMSVWNWKEVKEH